MFLAATFLYTESPIHATKAAAKNIFLSSLYWPVRQWKLDPCMLSSAKRQTAQLSQCCKLTTLSRTLVSFVTCEKLAGRLVHVYNTLGMILIKATLLLIHFLLYLNFMCMCMYCMNCFYIYNVVCLLFM